MWRLVCLFLLASSSVSAATIDFEEFAIGTGPSASTWLQSGDYEFWGGSGSGAVVESYPARIVNGNSGSKSLGASILFPGLDSFGGIATLSMRRTDGGAFAIQDLDLFFQTDSYGGYTSTTGTLAGGGAANLTGAVGTGDWLNLKDVTFTASGDGFGLGGVTAVQIDNIVVSAAVPIPAAAWLFGSALAGLGWLRRKKTV